MIKRTISIILAMILVISVLPYNKVEAAGLQNVVDIDNWVESSYPENNQGAIDSERVERNPLIEINFKHDIELIDRSKITISSDGHIYAVDVNKDTWINYDGNKLKIDINSLYRGGKSPLRSNAAYKVTIGEGALRRQNYDIAIPGIKIDNKEINLYFITGKHFIEEADGLNVEKYTSKEDITNDNISILSSSKLKKDGNIYIHFNREIKWNQWTANPKVKSNGQALQYFKLYKTPEAHKRDHNSQGILYDSEFRYNQNKESLPINGRNEIAIESVEIVNDAAGKRRVIKITPKNNLIPLNGYVVNLTKRDIVTDDYEKLLRTDINQVIWTMPDTEELKPQWLIENITSEEIIENKNGPKKSYTIHGAPNYNEHIDTENGKPITLFVDREVVINPRLIDPLVGVSLFEGYREGDISIGKTDIKWYTLKYFYEGNVKKTKVSFYPEGKLHSGRYYKLDIGNDIFKSRGNKSLDPIELNFVIGGDKTQVKGIYKFDITNEGEVTEGSRPLLTSDFGVSKNDMEFDVTGYNLTEDIKQLRFVRTRDGKTISIFSQDLKFRDVTKITGTIKGDAKAEFIKIDQDRECGSVNNGAGEYKVYIDFQDGTIAGGGNFIVKDRPIVMNTTPSHKDDYFDPEELYERFSGSNTEGYYIRAVFDNVGNTLGLLTTISDNIRVNLVGETINLVDSTKELKSKHDDLSGEFTVYIPLKDKLADGQDYNVFIPQKTIVEYKDVETGGNRCYSWNFSTNYLPKSERLYEGSLPEFYDRNYPIVIDGSMFHSDTTVRFRDSTGDYYKPDSVRMKDGNTLYIYLPRNSRLPVGVYDIIIKNGNGHTADMVYGVLSVVEEGDYIPNEEYRIKEERSRHTVKEIIKTSKDVIELEDKRNRRSSLELDLDDIMDSDVWVRSIQYPTSWRDSLSELKVKSKYVNATIRNLELHKNSDDNDIELRVGRVEPSMSDIIKKKLIGDNIKSNFIEVSGSNFNFTSLYIEIPYFESDGTDLKMLRYDEETRRVEVIPYIIDLIDGKLKGTSNKPGIFVIVE